LNFVNFVFKADDVYQPDQMLEIYNLQIVFRLLEFHLLQPYVILMNYSTR
jgi:hypothetical protein